MFNLGMGEITVIVLLALIILGPKKLPELASGLGKLIREIRKTTSDVKNEIQLDDAIRKPLEELREAVTLHPDELKRRDKLKRELRETVAKMEALAAESAANTETPASPDATVTDELPALPPGVAPPPFVVPPPIPPTGTVSRTTSPGLPGSLQRPLGTSVPGAKPPSDLSRTLTGLSEARQEARRDAARAAGAPLPVSDGTSGPTKSGNSGVASGNFGRVSGSSAAISPEPVGASSLFGPPPSGPIAAPPPVHGAADRGNATQILSEADLSAIVDGETPGPAIAPPPPPAAARTTGRAFTAATPRLPGATPPKRPPAAPANAEAAASPDAPANHEAPANPDDKKSETTG